jgi:plasmid maintenance system killer protein
MKDWERMGRSLVAFVVVVQNRRQDKASITVDGSTIRLIGSSKFEEMQDDRDKKYLKWVKDQYGWVWSYTP